MTTQEQPASPKDALNTENISLITAEYNALREEILKRIEIDHQLIALALIAPGTILTIGFQTRNASIMLIYPILALFLSAIWVLNETEILGIAAYIRDKIELKVGENNIGWQHYRASRSGRTFRGATLIGPRGMFIGSELLVTLAGIFVAKFNTIEIVLLIIGVLSIILTTALLAYTPLMWITQKKDGKKFSQATELAGERMPDNSVPQSSIGN